MTHSSPSVIDTHSVPRASYAHIPERTDTHRDHLSKLLRPRGVTPSARKFFPSDRA